MAKLVGADNANRDRSVKSMKELQFSRKGLTLGGVSWQELRDEGRKFIITSR